MAPPDPDGPASTAGKTAGEAGRVPMTRARLLMRLLVGVSLVAGVVALLDGLVVVTDAAGAPLSPLSLVPPLCAVAMALATRRAALSLAVAVLAGAVVAGDSLAGAVDVLGTSLRGALAASANVEVLLFALLLMGLVHLLTGIGAMRALADAVSRRIRTRRQAALVPAAMGTALFFDDYTNALVVGAGARPLTDRFRISREKLAWIVDSTSAPVAGLAVVSTWIAFEVALLDDQRAHFAHLAPSGWDLFILALPYRAYCLFTLSLVYLVIATGRDFGPMLRAERRALATGHPAAEVPLEAGRPGTVRAAWWHAALPLGLTVAFGLVGATFGRALLEPLRWLVMAALLGAALATLAARRLGYSRREVARIFGRGLFDVVPVLVILVLAFALREAAGAAGTERYLAATLEGVAPAWLPAATFLVSALIAFSTGTSWGTMALLIPIVVPLSTELTAHLPEAPLLVALSTAAILDGAIFGDHCSLISDTTLISSVASGCPLVDHFRTQLPYAVLAMVTALAMGYLALAWLPGVPAWAAWAAGVAAMTAFLFSFGRRA